MAQVGEVFTCQLCGNQVTVTKAGGNPEITCCGQAMTKEKQIVLFVKCKKAVALHSSATAFYLIRNFVKPYGVVADEQKWKGCSLVQNTSAQSYRRL